MSPTEQTAPPVEQKTDFQKWASDPERDTKIAKVEDEQAAPAEPEKAETQEEPAPESAPEKKTKEVDPDEQFENLPRWARKELRKLRETNRTLKEQLETAPIEKPKETAAPPKAEAKPAGEPVRPKMADFDTLDLYEAAHDEYVRKLARWELQQERAKEQAEQTAKQREAEAAKARNAWEKQVEAIEYDDFEEVAYNSRLPVSDAMFAALQESEHGAKMLYYLGKNPSVAAEIAQKSPAAQAAAIGKLEAKLFPETDSKPEAAVTKAPRPPKPLTGGTTSDDLGKEPDPKDFVKWERWKRAKERAERQ